MTITEGITTRSIDVPGARLHYEVRGGADSAGPLLFVIGSPMGAAEFVEHFVVERYKPTIFPKTIRVIAPTRHQIGFRPQVETASMQ